MFSIKKSFGYCNRCPLLNAPSCIWETNSEDDLSKVRVVFIAENPGKNEIQQEKPLVGVAGKIFRQAFNKYIKPTGIKYLITNAVLCATIDEDGKTINPSKEAIECCKPNFENFIEICKPDLIVAMGQTIASALGICETGITKYRSRCYKYKDYKVFLTVHPSYVKRNYNKEYPFFEKDFISIAKELDVYSVDNNITENKPLKQVINENNIYYYKIPNKYYSSDYNLVDVQVNHFDESIVYIFRNKDNEKEYYKIHNATKEYYYYECKDYNNNKLIEPYKNLELKICEYNEKHFLDPNKTYEGDLTLSDKHTIDYYLQKQSESKVINLNKLFVDIEVYSGENREFPQPNEAKYPINAISFKYNDEDTKTLLLLNLDYHTKNIKYDNTEFFTDERSLLSHFISEIHKYNPDVITGWNFKHFDMLYICNRLKNLKMNMSNLSPFNYVNPNTYSFQVTGYIILDMLELYKMFTYSGRESYTLDFISKLELGDEKVKHKFENLNSLYIKDINQFISYNKKDVDLLYELDKKLDHINFLNTVRESVKCCWKSAQTTMGQIDAMMVSHLKQKGLSSKNSGYKDKQKFEGAYVLQPEAGIYEYLIDLDYSSLYPNLIRTYNIGPNTLVAKVDESISRYYIYDNGKLNDTIKIIFDPIYNTKEKTISKEDFINFVKDKIITINGCIYKQHKDELSVFSEILDFHIDKRSEYKEIMKEAIANKDDNKRKYYHTRQLAEKILVNASYGVLGNEKFRFFNINLASSITSSGREAVKASAYGGNRYLMYGDKIDQIPYITDEDLEQCKKESLVYMDTDSDFFEMLKWIEKYHPNADKKEIKELVLNKVRDLETFLNDDYLKRFVEQHNVDRNRSYLNLKQEVFAKRALFPGPKKRYALFITNRENVDVEEMEIKGLDVNRSDYPSYTKKCLTELLDIILKKEDVTIDDILKYQNKVTEDITIKIKNGDLSVLKPVSYSKQFSSYKRVPIHVHAMEWWNQIEYEYFVPGTRGYFCKLQAVETSLMDKEKKNRYQNLLNTIKKNTIDKIVVPIEVPRMPKYYIPDVKAMLQFAWIDRCNLLTGNLIQSSTNSLMKF